MLGSSENEDIFRNQIEIISIFRLVSQYWEAGWLHPWLQKAFPNHLESQVQTVTL